MAKKERHRKAPDRMVAVKRFTPRPPQPDMLFEVKRDGEDVWLRPLKSTDVVHFDDPEQSREFITGTLKTNPFKDGSEPLAWDGNRRTQK